MTEHTIPAGGTTTGTISINAITTAVNAARNRRHRPSFRITVPDQHLGTVGTRTWSYYDEEIARKAKATN